MKNIKKILLTMAMTMALGTSAFAASGFEFLFQVAGGLNWGIPERTLDTDMKGSLGADAGIDAQIGYMFQVKDGFGISVLGELGYSWDLYNMGYGDTSVTGSWDSISGGNYQAFDGFNISTYYHSFKIGLLPKFNIGVGSKGAIALGIGGGVKIPLAGNLGTTVTIAGNYTTTEDAKTETHTALKRGDITDLFSPSIIGYLKVTFDYYLFFTDNIGMNFGLYLGGDFGMRQKETKLGLDAFDFGLQLGFRFGPKA